MKIKLLLLSALLGCAFAAQAQTIATVNGQPISKEDQDQWMQQVIQNGGKDTPEARKQITDNLVANAIITQEAKKQGVDKDPKVKFAIEYAKFRILQESLLRNEMAKHPVSEEKVKARYEQEKAALGSKDYNASHILVKDEKLAKELCDKIKAGADFGALAKEFSMDQGSAENGGQLGWNKPAVFVKPFAAALQKLKKGEVTAVPVKSEFGWHVIKVNDIKDAPLPSYDQVKDQIREGLELQEEQKYMESLLKSAKIVYPDKAAK